MIHISTGTTYFQPKHIYALRITKNQVVETADMTSSSPFSRILSFCFQLKLHWKEIAVGQVFAFLLASTGALSSELSNCSLSVPAFQIGLIYFLCSFHLLRFRNVSYKSKKKDNETHRCTEQFTDDNVTDTSCSRIPIRRNSYSEQEQFTSSHLENMNIPYTARTQTSPLIYFLMAFLDVEANYVTYLAFRYTTLTSVTLLDALAIPSAMVCSRLLLSRKYRFAHFVGSLICICGIGVNVLSDYDDTKDNMKSYQPHKLRGDILGIIGGLLYGLNDVLTERAVKHSGSVDEYLGFIGFFGLLICLVQSILLERDAIVDFFTQDYATEMENEADDATCSRSKGIGLLLAFAILSYLSYNGMSQFLIVSEATLLNLSLLTGDLWAVIFSVVAENITPPPLFWFALILVICGVILYESAPSPLLLTTNDICENDSKSGIDNSSCSTEQQNGAINELV